MEQDTLIQICLKRNFRTDDFESEQHFIDDLIHVEGIPFRTVIEQISHLVQSDQRTDFLLKTIGILDDDINGFLKRPVRIDAILDGFAIGLDRCDRRLQIMRDVLNHLLLLFILLLKFRLHLPQGIGDFADFIPAVHSENGRFIILDLRDIGTDLIERVDQARNPDRQQDEQSQCHQHVQIDDIVDEQTAEFKFIGTRHQRDHVSAVSQLRDRIEHLLRTLAGFREHIIPAGIRKRRKIGQDIGLFCFREFFGTEVIERSLIRIIDRAQDVPF